MNPSLPEQKLHSWEVTGWYQPLLYTLKTEMGNLNRIGRHPIENLFDGWVFYDAPGKELILFFSETTPRFRIGRLIADATNLNVEASVTGGLFRKITITSHGQMLFEKSYLFPFWYLLMDDGQWDAPDKFESLVNILNSPSLQRQFVRAPKHVSTKALKGSG